jgi:PAS domain S-box-containing protein
MDKEIIHILLIEDNPGDIRLLQELMTEAVMLRFKLTHTNRLSTGLERLAKGDLDVVLLDLSLPDSQGLETLTRLHAQAPGLPIVVLTGLEDEALGVTLVQAGAQDYFVKGEVTGHLLARSVRYAIERKRAEETLRRNEELLRQILDTNPNIIFVKDRTAKIILANQALADAYQMRVEQIVGQSQAKLHSKAGMSQVELEQWLADDREVIDTGQPKVTFEQFTHYDGSLHFNHTRKFPLELADGKRGVLVISEDISERRQLEEQLRQSQKMEAIGRLAGGIAHDFNNLLMIITGYSELLLERHLDDQNPLHRHVVEINNAGERAAGLTRQLLAFSRKQLLQPEVLDLNAIVTNVDKMLQRLIGEDIDLISVLGRDLGRVKVDPGQMEQVIMNLAVNARDAMPQGGKITIETANVELDDRYIRQHAEVTPGPYVMLALSDTGTGMDKETISHIFEPFFTTKEQSKGTGLGLATVYGIVKQSGGHIWVYSEIGQGTMFKVYFPRVEEAGAAGQQNEAQPALPPGSETILLVEDEAEVRELILDVLTERGYTVLEARNGDEALLLGERRSGPIHLLLTDVVMPGGMNGRELAERLTALHPEIKVLYMSGYTDEAIVHHGVLDRGTIFLQKPFTPGALERKMRQLLDVPD